MKFLLSLALLAATARAAEVAPDPGQLDAASIEGVIFVQAESVSAPAVRFILSRAGGFGENPAHRRLNRVYLTFSKGKDSFDVKGSYLIAEGVTQFRVTKIDLRQNFMNVYFLTRDENGEVVQSSRRLNVAAAMQEIETGTPGDGEKELRIASTVDLSPFAN